LAYKLGNGDVIAVKYFCWDGQQNGVNVVHYICSDLVVGNVTDQNVADTLSTEAAIGYKDYLNVADEYAGVAAQVRFPLVQPTVKSVVSAGAGSDISDKLPSSVALLLSTRTAMAGRSGRGRMFLPFWSGSYNAANGKPNAAAITEGNDMAAILFGTHVVTNAGSSITLKPVIFSKDGLGPITPITSVLVRTEWSHQTRRSDLGRPDLKGP